MERRTYLGSLGTVGITSVAGCLGDLLGGDSNPDTILEPPEEEAQHADYSYYTYGEEFPSFSLTDPIAEETVSRDDFVGERPFVITYFYGSCPDGMCDALLQHLARIQEDAIESGYEDEVGLLAVTFDPDRDTADALRAYSTERGIDPDAGHWHYLRPEDNETAKTVLNETFGLPLRRDEESSNNESTNETAAGNESGNESSGSDGLEYTFTHSALVQIVNERGIVERAYPRASRQRDAVNTRVMVEDTRTVVGVDE
ncbi:SCO family protein [Natrinema sp. CBA1119]|uniref:SCO family protein n=1 Tax=Natrinema sp. CBA1119 TaxID=1608465 RepID=UPI000BF2DA33|nr:SCO family protein [Natrinema sp. CBA1119]PGF17290.1 SCO family protein [Natrinema sp. CBA1119]